MTETKKIVTEEERTFVEVSKERTPRVRRYTEEHIDAQIAYWNSLKAEFSK